MITLKFEYSNKEYIYSVKSYEVDEDNNRFSVRLDESKDKLFNWIRNDCGDGAKEFTTNIKITYRGKKKNEEITFIECKLYKFSYLSTDGEYEITISYKEIKPEE